MALLDNGATSGEQGDITDIPCNYCFYDLFRGSTGITSVSENFLPATSLVSGCYGQIFDGCSSLNLIKIGYIGDYDSQYFYLWVDGIASSGTFYYNGNEIAQDFQLPSGWAKEKF